MLVALAVTLLWAAVNCALWMTEEAELALTEGRRDVPASGTGCEGAALEEEPLSSVPAEEEGAASAELGLPRDVDQAAAPETGTDQAAAREEVMEVKPAPAVAVEQSPVAQLGTASGCSSALMATAQGLVAEAVEEAVPEVLWEGLRHEGQRPAGSSQAPARRRLGSGFLRRLRKGLSRARKCFLCACCMPTAQED